MISEFILASCAVATYRGIESYYNKNKWKTKELKEDIKIFNEVCTKAEENYLLIDGHKTKYGTKFTISLKDKNYSNLEKLKGSLEIEYKSEVELIQNDNKCTATLDIFRNRLNDEDNIFEPIALQPYEIYVGMSTKFEHIKVNLNTHPHVLISGSTGSGKSEELKIILTNLINNNTDKQVNIHVSNISLSNDFRSFMNCTQLKSYVEDIHDTEKQLEYLMHVYEKRLKIFKSNDCGDIKDFNYKKREENRMAYHYLVIDEFADYYPEGKADEENDVKKRCYNMIKHLVRKGRKVGLMLICCIQRSDTTVLDPSLKSNLTTKITFNQINKASALVVSDNTDIVDVGERICYVSFGCDKYWSRSLYNTDAMIRKYVKKSIVTNRQSQPDFNSFLKIQKQNKEEQSAQDKPKAKAKAISKKTKKSKVVELEVATTESNQDNTKSRVKNITVEEIDSYEVVNGTICTKIKRKIE